MLIIAAATNDSIDLSSMHEPVQTSHVEQMVNKEADVEGGGDDTEFDVDNLGKELHWRSHLKKDAESTARVETKHILCHADGQLRVDLVIVIVFSSYQASHRSKAKSKRFKALPYRYVYLGTGKLGYSHHEVYHERCNF